MHAFQTERYCAKFPIGIDKKCIIPWGQLFILTVSVTPRLLIVFVYFMYLFPEQRPAELEFCSHHSQLLQLACCSRDCCIVCSWIGCTSEALFPPVRIFTGCESVVNTKLNTVYIFTAMRWQGWPSAGCLHICASCSKSVLCFFLAAHDSLFKMSLMKTFLFFFLFFQEVALACLKTLLRNETKAVLSSLGILDIICQLFSAAPARN